MQSIRTLFILILLLVNSIVSGCGGGTGTHTTGATSSSGSTSSGGSSSSGGPSSGVPYTAINPVTVNCSDATSYCVGSGQEYSSIQSAIDAAELSLNNDNSIQHIVSVYAGTYDGFVVGTSGTITHQFVIQAQEAGVNVTTSQSKRSGDNPNDSIYIANSNYVTVLGFNVIRGTSKFDGMPGYGISSHRATADSPMHGLIIANNTVSYSGSANIYMSQIADSLVQGNTTYGSNASHGIYVANGGSDNTRIVGNLSYNNSSQGIQMNADKLSGGGDGIQSSLVIEGNIFHSNDQNGIQLIGVENSVIQNNLIYGNERHGIRAFPDDNSPGVNNLDIINNTIVVLNNGNSTPIKFTSDLGGHLVFNNILVKNNNQSTSIESIIVESNLFTSDYNITDPGFSIGTNSREVSDPTTIFSSLSSNDYKLKVGSIAVDNAIAIFNNSNAPTIDLEGNNRPSGTSYDIGAYEHQ